MLSLLHGIHPYVTGRSMSAFAACSEVGVGPTKADDVLIVFKSFMTRVGFKGVKILTWHNLP